MRTGDIKNISEQIDQSMIIRYRIGLDQMQITDTPGYWEDKEPRIHHGHPLHGCLGCSGPFKATYAYFDSERLCGKFASVTRSWKLMRDAAGVKTTCEPK